MLRYPGEEGEADGSRKSRSLGVSEGAEPREDGVSRGKREQHLSILNSAERLSKMRPGNV